MQFKRKILLFLYGKFNFTGMWQFFSKKIKKKCKKMSIYPHVFSKQKKIQILICDTLLSEWVKFVIGDILISEWVKFRLKLVNLRLT